MTWTVWIMWTGWTVPITFPRQRRLAGRQLGYASSIATMCGHPMATELLQAVAPLPVAHIADPTVLAGLRAQPRCPGRRRPRGGLGGRGERRPVDLGRIRAASEDDVMSGEAAGRGTAPCGGARRRAGDDGAAPRHGRHGSRVAWGRRGAGVRWAGRVMVCDLPGHGASAHLDDYSFAGVAATLARAVSALGRVVVVGHSFGGYLALLLASSHYGLEVSAAVATGVKVNWTIDELERAASFAARRRAGSNPSPRPRRDTEGLPGSRRTSRPTPLTWPAG